MDEPPIDSNFNIAFASFLRDNFFMRLSLLNHKINIFNGLTKLTAHRRELVFLVRSLD